MKKTRLLALGALLTGFIMAGPMDAQAQLGGLVKGLADKAIDKAKNGKSDKSDNKGKSNNDQSQDDKKQPKGEAGIPKAATDYRNPAGWVAYRESGFVPYAKMTPTADAKANDPNASNNNPAYDGAKTSVSDLCGAFERLPFCMFPCKPYYKYKDFYYFGQESDAAIWDQYDKLCLSLIKYPQVFPEGGISDPTTDFEKLQYNDMQERQYSVDPNTKYLAFWKWMDDLWVKMPAALPTGHNGYVPLQESLHQRASAAFCTNPADSKGFTFYMMAMHISTMESLISLDVMDGAIIDSKKGTRVGMLDNMKNRNTFSTAILDEYTPWPVIRDYARFCLNEYNRLFAQRESLDTKGLLKAYQYGMLALTFYNEVFTLTSTIKKSGNSAEYQTLKNDLFKVNVSDINKIIVDLYFDISRPVDIGMPKCPNQSLYSQTKSIMKEEFGDKLVDVFLTDQWSKQFDDHYFPPKLTHRINSVIVVVKHRGEYGACTRIIRQNYDESTGKFLTNMTHKAAAVLEQGFIKVNYPAKN